jgi:ATP-dependent helicase/nuclease subunit B
MPSLTGSLKQAFAAGAIVVTPNRRLARALVALYDREQRAAGRTVWPSATALPWDAWLRFLWEEALAVDAVPANARLRTPVQSAHAWNRIVAAEAMPLIDPARVGILAAEAWALVHAWGAGGDSWRAWAGDGSADDCALFARWASRYGRELRSANAVDLAEFPDLFCKWVSAIAWLRDAAFAGFVEFSPQQERLLAALAATGARVTREDTLPADRGRILRASGATPRGEIARALAWARARAIADPAASIAIVVEDLANRKDEIRALADDILCPAAQWPGAEGAPRPYNLSLGAPLSEVPLIVAALDLLDWAERPLPLGRVAALLRSPWIAAGADSWMRRAELEAAWLIEGRAKISMRTAITALSPIDAAIAQRWADVDEGRWPTSASPREHAEAWRKRLAAFGWPGSRPLDSAEYQASRAFDEALAQFATLGALESRLSRADALTALRSHIASVVFQPESAPAPIQIAGMLEAAGQPFDALWVAGLAAERWPPAPRPSALLPVLWQRERNVPRSSAAREIAYASALTDQFARAGAEVVFSFPQRDDDHACTPSLLLPSGLDLASDDPAVPVTIAQAQFSRRARRECVADDVAPALEAGAVVRGGAGLVAAQSDCPFKGVAILRLGTETWPKPIDGLSARERGVLVHATLAAFWRAVAAHASLAAMSPQALESAVDAAIGQAIDTLPPSRWRTVTPLVREGERARIKLLVASWIERFERPRPAFAVSAVEEEINLAIGGLALNLRVDRIDALGDGGAALIDYKTGDVDPVGTWFLTRPRSPQLGLYTLAHLAAHPDRPVRAVAYAQLKPGKLALRGLAADRGAWPQLKLASSAKDAGVSDWRDAELRWLKVLADIGAEIVAGAAAVSPRDRKETCARCGRQSLCRIGAPAIEDREDDGDE